MHRRCAESEDGLRHSGRGRCEEKAIRDFRELPGAVVGAGREEHPIEPPRGAPAAGHHVELALRARAEKHEAPVVKAAEDIVERNLNERHGPLPL